MIALPKAPSHIGPLDYIPADPGSDMRPGWPGPPDTFPDTLIDWLHLHGGLVALAGGVLLLLFMLWRWRRRPPGDTGI